MIGAEDVVAKNFCPPGFREDDFDKISTKNTNELYNKLIFL